MPRTGSDGMTKTTFEDPFDRLGELHKEYEALVKTISVLDAAIQEQAIDTVDDARLTFLRARRAGLMRHIDGICKEVKKLGESQP